jgi:hypothetical protein
VGWIVTKLWRKEGSRGVSLMAMRWCVGSGCGGTFALRLKSGAEAEVCGGWVHGSDVGNRSPAGGV